jgi:hypothetical protein
VVERLYDRAHLLSAEKRNDVLSLDEVIRYGVDSYADPDYVTLYGLRPAEWYARGVRLLARTVVECTRDALAQRIADDVAAAVGDVDTVVIDPFAGSANTLYWLARRLGAGRAIGFEIDDRVFRATARNLSVVGFDAELAKVGCEHGFRGLKIAVDAQPVVFVAPPWGDALDPATGLDLRRTTPPVVEILDLLARTIPSPPPVFAVQIHERTLPATIDEVRSRAQWSTVTVYDINAPGQNHGVIVGRLRPPGTARRAPAPG